MLFSQTDLVGANEVEVLMLEPDYLKDPLCLCLSLSLSHIIKVDGNYKKCIFRRRLACVDEYFESESDRKSVEFGSSFESELCLSDPPRYDF